MPGLPPSLVERLDVPLIVAPMLRVSGPELVIAACRAGAIGAFPTANASSVSELDEWLGAMEDAGARAPHCPNLIIRSPVVREHLSVLLDHRVEVVITSVGSPAAVVEPLHSVGCLVLADVATLEHARKAVAAGADGLVLLTAGAGGQTGWMNPFAFVRAVRAFFDGPMVLAGGVSDGVALRAAVTLGCDLGYMGTRFIATHESMAAEAYKEMLVSSSMDDVLTTRAFTGLPTNMLVPSIVAAGMDPAALDEDVSPDDAREIFGGRGDGPRRWQEVFSAGHTVSGVDDVLGAGELVRRIADEYQ